MNDARHLAEIRRAKVLLDVSGAKEQQWLGHAVEEHVQQHAERAEFAAEAERRDHDARVVDAGISQQPAKVSLCEDKRGRHEDGRQAEDQEQVAGVIPAEASARQHLEADDAVERTVDESSAQQGRRGPA